MDIEIEPKRKTWGGDEGAKAAREAAEDESGCHGADGAGGSPAAEGGPGGGLQLHLRSVCAAVLFGQRGWRSTRRCCSGCCWQGICTGSSPRHGWRKRSTPTSRTSGSAGWIEQTRYRTRRRSARTGGAGSGTTTSRRRSLMRFCGSTSRRDLWAERFCPQI